MMLLSRAWYVILSFILAGALYVVFIAVGQYNRRSSVAMNEELASDSQVVGWALQIDARRRLDALLIGSVDKGVQDALVNANGKDRIPTASKDGARKALGTVNEKLPADYRADALFAVDREGRVVAQVGFDQANAFDDFELGGYPAVFDALHGYLRDDTWILGGKIYRVVARPVEFDVTQPPAGAIVALRAVDARFAQDLSKRTRTNVVFFAGTQRVASAVTDGFDASGVDLVANDLPSVAEDKALAETGHSEVHRLTSVTGAASPGGATGAAGDNMGAMYARLPGEAWELGGGFAVVRSKVSIAGPMGFLSGADDKDKSNVSWGLLVCAILLGSVIGIALSVLEHTVPMTEMVRQAARFKKGEIDFLQVARFKGLFRSVAQDINGGVERVIEKGGGVARKPADLESILGPVPAQPAMSAFSFPLQDGGSQSAAQAVASKGGSHAGPTPSPSRPGLPPPGGGSPSRPGSAPSNPSSPGFVPPRASSSGSSPQARPGGLAGSGSGPFQPPPPAAASAGFGGGAFAGALAGGAAPQRPPPPGGKPPPPAMHGMAGAAGGISPPPPQNRPGIVTPIAPPPGPNDEEDDDEATMVAAIPAEVLAAATGEHRVVEDTAEWLTVYEDFIRTKKQCGEPTDGLTFEKFQHTLKKNRDALMSRHGCKKVRFSVYVKEGRASLKATPVKD